MITRVLTQTSHSPPGPRGVQDLRYHANESLVLWTPGTPVSLAHHLSFTYRLSLANGSEVRRGRVSRPGLPLPGLLQGQAYTLEVLEECQGAWSSSPAAWSSSSAAWSSSSPAWSSSPAVVLFQGASVPMRPWALGRGLHGTATPSTLG